MDQLRALRIFSQVIAQGSFAGAARTLDMAPAGVTRAITELEAHLGVRLLNRSTRSLALTEIGETYLERARNVLSDLDDADALAGRATGQTHGNLRIVCPPAFATHQLAMHLPRFRSLYPGINLELASPGPVDSANENFDVSILSIGQQTFQGEFVARRLACSSFVICAAPAYLDRRGRPLRPGELLQHDGLIPAVAAVRRELTLFRQQPDTGDALGNRVTLELPPPALLTSQLELIYAAALSGLGIAGLPSFMAGPALQDGRLERVLPDWRGATLTLYAAMPTRKHVPARTKVFIDFLVNTFGGTERDPWLG